MKIHLKKLVILLIVSLGCTLSANANNIAINSDNFTIEGQKANFTFYKGKESLLLNGASATVKDISFINGIIEYDVAFTEKRNFVGVKFRQQDSENAEEFYIRPHQSGNPDANQYTPVFNGLAAWQLYHQGFAGKVNYNFDGWNHIKIIVAGNKGEVYINDMEKPAIRISEFLRPIKSGVISFSSVRADAHIANVSIVNHKQPKILPTVSAEKDSTLKNYLMKWQVSNSFNKSALDKVTNLDLSHNKAARWTPLIADNFGILNVAKVQGLQKSKDTAFAKTIIYSEKQQVKALHFGYSDQVKVFFNNQLIYRGDNSFRSRDYRYLGTIGLFDSIYLQLKKGKNELTFAVSEKFGGWGLQATLED
jgi:hypothetical protein